MRILFVLAAAAIAAAPALGQVTLPAEYRIKVGRLGKIEATSKTPVKWINLHDGLDLVPDSGGRWAFVLGVKAGAYKIAAFTGTAEGPSDPAYCLVTVEGSAPPDPAPPPAPGGADPIKATCRLRFGSSGCTATIIGPRRPDGYWHALTASHCTGSVGAVGQITLPDGRVFKCTVTARQTSADISWLKIEAADLGALPFAVLAKENPAVGTKVWHQGYGVDRPGNRESGTVAGGQDANGQLKFVINVSSGDSGSGIFREDTGELVGVVCCTSSRGSKVTMWGGSAIVAEKLKVADDRDYPIIVHPIQTPMIEEIIPLREAPAASIGVVNFLSFLRPFGGLLPSMR